MVKSDTSYLIKSFKKILFKESITIVGSLIKIDLYKLK